MYFLSNLEELMAIYNMNRSDVARACGISVSAVHSWWNRGCENISMQTLLKLSKCFNVTLEELVNKNRVPKQVVVYTSNEYTNQELQLIDKYANFLKFLRSREEKNNDN